MSLNLEWWSIGFPSFELILNIKSEVELETLHLKSVYKFKISGLKTKLTKGGTNLEPKRHHLSTLATNLKY